MKNKACLKNKACFLQHKLVSITNYPPVFYDCLFSYLMSQPDGFCTALKLAKSSKVAYTAFRNVYGRQMDKLKTLHHQLKVCQNLNEFLDIVHRSEDRNFSVACIYIIALIAPSWYIDKFIFFKLTENVGFGQGVFHANIPLHSLSIESVDSRFLHRDRHQNNTDEYIINALAAVKSNRPLLQNVDPKACGVYYHTIALASVLKYPDSILNVYSEACGNYYSEVALAAVLKDPSTLRCVHSKACGNDYAKVAIAAVSKDPSTIRHVESQYCEPGQYEFILSLPSSSTSALPDQSSSASLMTKITQPSFCRMDV